MRSWSEFPFLTVADVRAWSAQNSDAMADTSTATSPTGLLPPSREPESSSMAGNPGRIGWNEDRQSNRAGYTPPIEERPFYDPLARSSDGAGSSAVVRATGKFGLSKDFEEGLIW